MYMRECVCVCVFMYVGLEVFISEFFVFIEWFGIWRLFLGTSLYFVWVVVVRYFWFWSLGCILFCRGFVLVGVFRVEFSFG